MTRNAGIESDCRDLPDEACGKINGFDRLSGCLLLAHDAGGMGRLVDGKGCVEGAFDSLERIAEDFHLILLTLQCDDAMDHRDG